MRSHPSLSPSVESLVVLLFFYYFFPLWLFRCREVGKVQFSLQRIPFLLVRPFPLSYSFLSLSYFPLSPPPPYLFKYLLVFLLFCCWFFRLFFHPFLSHFFLSTACVFFILICLLYLTVSLYIFIFFSLFSSISLIQYVFAQ